LRSFLSLYAIECGIDDTAHEIGFEGTRLIEVIRALIEADKGILDDVFGHGLIVGDKKGRAKGFSLMAADQTLQPTNIATFQAADGLQIFHLDSNVAGAQQLLDIQFSSEKGW
jgi:hypothetical protein